MLLAVLLALAGFALQPGPQTVRAVNPPAYAISTGNGSNQSAQINHAFSMQLSAAVVSADFTTQIPNVTVTFTAPASGASGASGIFANTGTNVTTAVTNGTGLATASVLTANGTVGAFTVMVSAPNATSNFFFETNTLNDPNGVPTILSTGNGSNQAAQINTQFSTRMSAAVFDGSGGYVQGAVVTFTAPASGASGTFTDTGTAITTATTGSTGLATAAVFTANGTAGSYTVRVTTGTLSNGFALKNTLSNPNGVPDIISLSAGGNQQTKIDTTFTHPIQVAVFDGSGNYVQNYTVTFTVVAGNTGAGGTFANTTTTTTALTGSTGLATSSALTANHAAGNFTVMVTAGQASTTVSETNLAIDTTTALASTPNPSVVGQSVTLTATVAAASGNGTPGSTVAFKNGGNVITGCGSVTLNAAQATCTTTSLPLGTRSLTADYSGDAGYNPSTGSLSQVVNQASTTTGIISSVNPSTVGQSVMFTATVSVSAPGTGTPTGMVTFKDSGATIGTGTLINGQATYSTSALSAANHPITAVYGGDNNFTGSTSSAVNQDVRNPAPAITLISPAAAVTHAPATTVTITGTGFVSASAVHFGANTLSTTFVSPTQLTAVIPTADLSTVGSVTVTVVNLTPGGGTSNGVTFTVKPGPPASLTPTPATPQNVPVTTTLSLSVTVHDQYGNTVADGTAVTFTATTAGGATASLPNNGATTTTGGIATIIATANTVAGGPYTVTAAANGQSATFSLTNTPGPATSLTVNGFPSPATAGVAGNVTVTAKDANGNTATGYSGSVAITSSDPAAVLPANATLTNGVGTFTVTLKTVGTHSITATDTVTASITGAQTGIVVNPGTAATFTVSGCTSPVTAGTPCTMTVTAKDASANVATGYTGMVHLTSSDPAAVLPANATLTNGVGTFTVTLKTVGTHSITATDTVTASITGAQTGIVVNPGAATSLVVNSFPSTITAGISGTVTVTAKDANGNTVIGYASTVHFTSSDPAAVLPANATLTNGVGTFTVTLKTPGTQSITATDTVTASITGQQTGITVNGVTPAAVADSYTLTTGTTLTVNAAQGVLVNDTKGTPAATVTANTHSSHGTVTVNADGSFSYVSIAPFVGTDSFTYTLSNGNGSNGTGSSTATVTLTVSAATTTTLTTTAPAGAGSGNSGTASAPVLRGGGSITLGTVGGYNNGTTGNVSGVTYTSSNPNVASVDANGVVTGLSSGTATITITAPNGVRTTIVITVSGGTGGGLMAPAPQPGAKPAGVGATAASEAIPAPQPTRKADGGTGSGNTGAQPQPQTASTPTVTAPPAVQPVRR